MNALQRLFANGHAESALPDEVEAAVSEMLREAGELRRLLRDRRERKRARSGAPTE
jgi:hypothetical protein